MTRFETETVDVEIDAPAPGVVVLNEVLYPGWRVRVDGQEQTPFSVDVFLRGVLVPAGAHRIRWDYRPSHWGLLVGLWVVGMATILLVGTASLLSGRPITGRRTGDCT